MWYWIGALIVVAGLGLVVVVWSLLVMAARTEAEEHAHRHDPPTRHRDAA